MQVFVLYKFKAAMIKAKSREQKVHYKELKKMLINGNIIQCYLLTSSLPKTFFIILRIERAIIMCILLYLYYYKELYQQDFSKLHRDCSNINYVEVNISDKCR